MVIRYGESECALTGPVFFLFWHMADTVRYRSLILNAFWVMRFLFITDAKSVYL